MSVGFKNRSVIDFRLSEVVSALSFALDITEGQPEGHAARSCLIGMRIARELGLPPHERSALFYALLLKDLGCSSNAAKVCYLFQADDRAAKRNFKTVDWTRLPEELRYLAQNIGKHGSIAKQLSRWLRIAIVGKKAAKELVQIRCDRGASIATRLGFPEMTALAIRSLDEHWDGRGHPTGLTGEAIPLAARILSIAQTVEVFFSQHGLEATCAMANKRKGTWFDPELVRAFQTLRHDRAFWAGLRDGDLQRAVSKVEPADFVERAGPDRLDAIAEGFGQVIDAKSPWTLRHSQGVAEVATGIAEVLGLRPHERRDVWRAAYLHDIGKLGVSNLILDKPGKLTDHEMDQVRKHPMYTRQILDRVTCFAPLAEMAAAHHERLDGKGYYRGMTGKDLTKGARILAVADMYEALAAERPYRKDLTGEEVMEILHKNAGPGICPEAFAALRVFLDRSGFIPFKIAA